MTGSLKTTECVADTLADHNNGSKTNHGVQVFTYSEPNPHIYCIYLMLIPTLSGQSAPPQRPEKA